VLDGGQDSPLEGELLRGHIQSHCDIPVVECIEPAPQANVLAECTRWTSTFAVVRGDKMAVHHFAKFHCCY